MAVSKRAGVIAVLAAALLLAGACGPRGQGRSQPGGPSPSTTAATARAWSALPEAPLSARHGAHGFWVDGTFLAMGGRDTPPCPPGADCEGPTKPALRDGARYRPDERHWTVTAEAPVPLEIGVSTAVSGDTVYWWLPPHPQGEARPSFVAYDVGDDRWDVLPPPPRMPGRDWLQLAAAGGKVIAYRTSHESRPQSADLAYDPATATWRELPVDPLGPSFDRTIVGNGDGLLLFALDLVPDPNGVEPSLYRAAALDLDTDVWRQLPDSEVVGGSLTWFPVTGAVVNPALATSDGGATNTWGRHYPHGGVLDLDTDTWSPLPVAPSAAPGLSGPPAADERVIFNGQGWLLDTRTDAWLPVPRPRGAPDEGSAVAVGDGDVYVWGGATWDPAGGTAPTEGTMSAVGWVLSDAGNG